MLETMKELAPEVYFDTKDFSHRSLFDGCNYAWEPLLKIVTYLKDQRLGNIEVEIPEGVWLVNPESISIGQGTIIEPGAYIAGPCIIGKECQIRHAAYLRGEVIIGDGCVIGHASEVKSSIFLNEAKAAHFAYIGNSILGNRVNLGAGVRLANLRFDRAAITLSTSSGQIETGLKKFGAILGDDVQLGCNAVANPGTLCGKGSFCYPNTTIGGILPAGSAGKRQ